MIYGIDVSHHQEFIDWGMVKKAGARFAFIKASEGVGFTDPMFEENIRGAVEAGVLPGSYHFFCRATIRLSRPGITPGRCKKTRWMHPRCRRVLILKRPAWARRH